MSATYDQAVNEILALFKAAWDTTGFPVAWPNVASSAVPPTTTIPWARVTVRHNQGAGGQATLSNDNGKRRFDRIGIVSVQLFVPSGEGLSRAYDLVKIVSDAFEGKSTASQVWFRNVRSQEVGPDGNFFQVNVLADFTYDEVK